MTSARDGDLRSPSYFSDEALGEGSATTEGAAQCSDGTRRAVDEPAEWVGERKTPDTGNGATSDPGADESQDLGHEADALTIQCPQCGKLAQRPDCEDCGYLFDAVQPGDSAQGSPVTARGVGGENVSRPEGDGRKTATDIVIWGENPLVVGDGVPLPNAVGEPSTASASPPPTLQALGPLRTQVRQGIQRSPVEQFRDAIAAHYSAPDQIIGDGRLHRFSSSGRPGDNAGWYVVHLDGAVPAGVFGCWREGAKHAWRADIGRSLTAQEERDHRQHLDAMKRQADEQRDAGRATAAAIAGYLAGSLAPASPDHPYLARKGVLAHGVLQSGDALFVPMRDADCKIHSYQEITPGGDKRFRKGGLKKGCFFLIGEPAEQLCIAEGFATAASVYEATGIATAVAFDAGNLLPVAEALRAKYATIPIVICADDDTSGVGLSKASVAARTVNGKVALPVWTGERRDGATDFNDLASAEGREAVLRAVMSAKPPAQRSAITNSTMKDATLNPISLVTLRDAMSAIDPAGDAVLSGDKPIKVWRAVGMALHWECGGSEEALAAWKEWCSAQAEQCASAWAGFKGPDQIQVSAITGATILKLARKAGWKGGNAATAVEPDTPWGEPEDLFRATESADYPLTALPGGIGRAVREVIGFVQCPPALAACSALAALSLAGQALVDVRRSEALIGPVSLFVLAIAESGERKSACDRYFMSAIKDWERASAIAAEPTAAHGRAALASWSAQRDGILNALKQAAKGTRPTKSAKSTEELQAQLAALELDPPPPVWVPNLIYNDATQEALAYALARRWPSGGVMSAEAGAVFGGHAMGTDSAMRNMAFLNILWDGADAKFDRRTSESFVVRDARLTMGLAVQPETVRAFFAASKGLARDIGFAARCLVAWPASTQGTRLFKFAPDANPALTAFGRRLAQLLDATGSPDAMGKIDRRVLDLSSGAREVWIAFHDDVERELGATGDLTDVRDVASKAADNAARIAALFHLFETGPEGVVSQAHMASAAKIMTWHIYEARRFYGAIALPRSLANALKLDEWLWKACSIRTSNLVAPRDVQRMGPNSVREKRRLDEAMMILTEANRARWVSIESKSIIQVNPALLDRYDGAARLAA